MSTICEFDDKINKHDIYRGEDCLKKFCECLKNHAMEIINFEKKKIIPLTSRECESYATHEYCHICRKNITEDADDKKYCKVRDHCIHAGKYRRAAHSM